MKKSASHPRPMTWISLAWAILQDVPSLDSAMRFVSVTSRLAHNRMMMVFRWVSFGLRLEPFAMVHVGAAEILRFLRRIWVDRWTNPRTPLRVVLYFWENWQGHRVVFRWRSIGSVLEAWDVADVSICRLEAIHVQPQSINSFLWWGRQRSQ